LGASLIWSGTLSKPGSRFQRKNLMVAISDNKKGGPEAALSVI
jgi:hypothetical protein